MGGGLILAMPELKPSFSMDVFPYGFVVIVGLICHTFTFTNTMYFVVFPDIVGLIFLPTFTFTKDTMYFVVFPVMVGRFQLENS